MSEPEDKPRPTAAIVRLVETAAIELDPAPPAGDDGDASSQTGASPGSTGKGSGGKAPRGPRRPKRTKALDRKLAQLPRTDLGNTERFVARHGDNFRWCAEIGWFAWDGKRWSQTEADGLLKIATHDTVRAIFNEAREIRGTDDDIVVGKKRGGADLMLSDALQEWWLVSQGAGHIGCLPSMVGPYLEAAAADFDRDDRIFNVQNGTLEFGSQHAGFVKFRPHRREDLITKISPAAYDPKAICPLYDGMLAFVQPEAEMRRFLHRWGGYGLTGDTSEQSLTFNHGKGKNGKSTLINAFAYVAGDYGRSIPIETFIDAGRARASGQATPDLAMLAGVRFLRTSEPEKGAKLAEAMIKLATGGEAMPVRHLNMPYFDLEPKFKLTISGNYRPTIDGADDGIWRRVMLVPWSVSVPEAQRDKQLGKKLEAEAAGILNRMLDGLRDWLENGMAIPKDVSDATQAYRAESDPLGRFLEACTKVTAGRRTQSSVLHRLFCAWAKSSGEKEWTAKGLSRALTERGFKNKHSDVVWWLDLETTRLAEEFVDADGKPHTVLRKVKLDEPPLDADPF